MFVFGGGCQSVCWKTKLRCNFWSIPKKGEYFYFYPLWIVCSVVGKCFWALEWLCLLENFQIEFAKRTQWASKCAQSPFFSPSSISLLLVFNCYHWGIRRPHSIPRIFGQDLEC